MKRPFLLLEFLGILRNSQDLPPRKSFNDCEFKQPTLKEFAIMETTETQQSPQKQLLDVQDVKALTGFSVTVAHQKNNETQSEKTRKNHLSKIRSFNETNAL